MNYFKQIALVFGARVERPQVQHPDRASALRAFIRVAPDVVRRLDQEHADRTDFRAIGRVIAPWGRRIGDLRFETEGAWKRSGTTVDSLAKELRLALQYPGGRRGLDDVSHDSLITGGAGFIGSNLVHYALAHTVATPRRRRQADVRGQPAEPRAAADGSARDVRRRPTSPIATPMARVFAEHRPDAVLNLAAETHVDRSIDGPRPFIDTNIVGTFVLLEAARRIRGRARRAERDGVPLPARVDRRGVRHARADGPVQRGDAVRAELAVRGEQGGGRSPGARLLPHLRPAGADHELLEQLRAVPVSGEADSADDPERARRAAAADLRRRRQRARLAARRGSLRRHAAGARRRAGRARSTTSAAATSGRTWRSSIASATRSTSCVRRPRIRRCSGAASYRALKTFVPDRPGPRSPLRDRRDEDPPRARLARRAHVRERPARDGRSGISTTATGASTCRPAGTIASASGS